MPETEQRLPRFRAAHTQVLGVSVDSVYCHAHWARDLGGISFPLLADFHPKGEVGSRYGLYLPNDGIDDRATVLIDAGGVVRHASSVTPSGRRNISELAALCEEMDRAYQGKVAEYVPPPGPQGELVLYVKQGCPFCRATMAAGTNLHLLDRITVRDVVQDPGARDELQQLAGTPQTPCLVVDGKPLHESKDIVAALVRDMDDLP